MYYNLYKVTLSYWEFLLNFFPHFYKKTNQLLSLAIRIKESFMKLCPSTRTYRLDFGAETVLNVIPTDPPLGTPVV